MRIQAERLTHVYAPDGPFTAVAIDRVSFTIESGEFVGIIGHTGSGKSTLVQHMNGLLRASAGSISVGGEAIPLKGGNMREIRKKVGMVFQYPEYQLFEETVAQDIAFGPKNLGFSGAELDERVRKAMEDVRLDYGEIAHRSPFELSGGQKRRVAIAGVLAMRPEVLILDEPSAGLDPRGRDEITRLMKDLSERGHTIIMISHNMDEVAELCGRVLVMEHGKLLLQGTPGEVFSDAEKIRKTGLSLPEAAEIAEQLRARGFDLPEGIVTMKALEDAIVEYFEGGTSVGSH